jgi:60 kDa SS-A/Ro ribonucleoprotein
MGLTALVRNLGNMSRVGAIKSLSEHERVAVSRLNDDYALRKSRLHPFSILQAMAV